LIPDVLLQLNHDPVATARGSDAMRFAMKRTLLLPLLLTLPLLMSTSLITRADKPAVVADLIIINAKVHTLDPNQPSAEAIAVLANRVVAIGSTKEIRNLAGANTRVIDAKGQLVLPGFNDAHVHFM